ELVDQLRAQVFADGRDAAAEPDIATTCRISRVPQRELDAAGDEVEYRASFHRDRRARMMRQHEHRHVIRRRVAPPAFPAVVRPRAANRTEHVATEYPRADPCESSRGAVVIGTGFSAVAALHPLPRLRGD